MRYLVCNVNIVIDKYMAKVCYWQSDGSSLSQKLNLRNSCYFISTSLRTHLGACSEFGIYLSAMGEQSHARNSCLVLIQTA